MRGYRGLKASALLSEGDSSAGLRDVATECRSCLDPLINQGLDLGDSFRVGLAVSSAAR